MTCYIVSFQNNLFSYALIFADYNDNLCWPDDGLICW